MSTAIAFAPVKRALAKLAVVRSEPNDATRYVAERLQELKRKGMTQAEMARIGGISTAQISNLLDGSRNAGRKTMLAAAKILKTSWPLLEEEAGRWAEANKSPPNPKHAGPIRWSELEPRYPNLLIALKQLGDQSTTRTRVALAGIALHSGEDLDVGVWQAMALNLERKLRRADKSGEAIGDALPDEDDAPPFGR